MDQSQFIEIRKYLHQNPELSEHENSTGLYIQSVMKRLWPDVTIERCQKSLIFSPPHIGECNKHIAFRCELDALPIAEINDFEHASTIQGISHKCGHDGHMAILLRLTHLLKNKPIKGKKISFIFQSAEENGVGAQQIVNQSALFKKEKLDHIFALHNVPSYPIHQVVIKNGIFTPTVISTKINFFGKTSHAAEPQNGINPAFTIAETLLAIKEKAKQSNLIMAPVEMKLGDDAYGTSAGEGMLGITIRSYKPADITQFKEWLESFVSQQCISSNLRYELIWFEAFNSIINEKSSSNIIRAAAKHLDLELNEKEEPFPWGEDFGIYTEQIPGAMFGLGAGINHPSLHNPDYDFPDELIISGSDMFYAIASQI